MVKGDRIHLVDFSFIFIFNKEDNYMSACSVSYTPNLSDIGSIPEGSKCFPFRVGPFSCISHSWKLLKGISLDFSQMQRIIWGFVAEEREGRRRICFISFAWRYLLHTFCLGIFVTYFLLGDICYTLFAWGYLLHTFCSGIFVTHFLLGDIPYILFNGEYILHTFYWGIFVTHFFVLEHLANTCFNINYFSLKAGSYTEDYPI